jgi:hypothetical protein
MVSLLLPSASGSMASPAMAVTGDERKTRPEAGRARDCRDLRDVSGNGALFSDAQTGYPERSCMNGTCPCNERIPH